MTTTVPKVLSPRYGRTSAAPSAPVCSWHEGLAKVIGWEHMLGQNALSGCGVFEGGDAGAGVESFHGDRIPEQRERDEERGPMGALFW